MLEADDNPLEYNCGTKVEKDIIQFVLLRKYNPQGVDFSLVSSGRSIYLYMRVIKLTCYRLKKPWKKFSLISVLHE